jgi:signal peptidase I
MTMLSVARRLARHALHVLAWLLLLTAVGVLVIAILVPRLAGATPYTIETSSMRPTMPPGSLVVVRPTSADQIGVGSVITYQLRSGEPVVVTHRVIAVGVDGSGEVRFQTQGDANAVPDSRWVRPVQVRGTVWYAVRGLGRLNTLLTGEQHRMATYAAAGLLMIYPAALFLADIRRALHRATRRGEVAHAATT